MFSMPLSVKIWFLAVAILIGYVWLQTEYQAVKKYYPNLTMWEYFILHNKLRITPNGD